MNSSFSLHAGRRKTLTTSAPSARRRGGWTARWSCGSTSSGRHISGTSRRSEYNSVIVYTVCDSTRLFRGCVPTSASKAIFCLIFGLGGRLQGRILLLYYTRGYVAWQDENRLSCRLTLTSLSTRSAAWKFLQLASLDRGRKLDSANLLSPWVLPRSLQNSPLQGTQHKPHFSWRDWLCGTGSILLSAFPYLPDCMLLLELSPVSCHKEDHRRRLVGNVERPVKEDWISGMETNSRFQFSVNGTRYHLLSVILFGKVDILNDLTKGFHCIIVQTIIMLSQSLLLSLY